MESKFKLVRVIDTPTEKNADFFSRRRVEIDWYEVTDCGFNILCPPQRALKVICPDIEIARNKRGLMSDFTPEEKDSLKYPLSVGHEYFVEGKREIVAIDWDWCLKNLPPHGVYDHLTNERLLEWAEQPDFYLMVKNENGRWTFFDLRSSVCIDL